MADHPTPTPARTLAPEEYEAERDQADRLDAQARGVVAAGRKVSWYMARIFFDCNLNQVWTKLGMTKGEWLGRPEMSVAKSTFDMLVYVWNETHVLNGLGRKEITEGEANPDQSTEDAYSNRQGAEEVEDEVDFQALEQYDPTKVNIVIPAIRKAKVPFSEAMSDSMVLSQSDLREKYRKPAEAPQEPAQSSTGAFDPAPALDEDEALWEEEALVIEGFITRLKELAPEEESVGWLLRVFDSLDIDGKDIVEHEAAREFMKAEAVDAQ